MHISDEQSGLSHPSRHYGIFTVQIIDTVQFTCKFHLQNHEIRLPCRTLSSEPVPVVSASHAAAWPLSAFWIEALFNELFFESRSRRTVFRLFFSSGTTCWHDYTESCRAYQPTIDILEPWLRLIATSRFSSMPTPMHDYQQKFQVIL